MEKVLIVFLSAFVLLAGPLHAASSKDLAEINRQTKEKEEQIKKYKEQEARLAREIKTLTQKEKQAEILSVKIAGDIEVVQSQKAKTLEHKALMEDNLPLWQNLLQQEVSNYVLQDALKTKYFNSGELEANLAALALLQTHLVFLHKLNGEVQESQEKLEDMQGKNQALLARKNKVESQKKDIKGDSQKKREDMLAAHQLYEKAQADLAELKHSAEQMQKILKAAEAKRRAQARNKGTQVSKSAINIEKNSLPWPVSGKIISRFGKEYNSQLKTWIFRDGIKISAQQGAEVKSVAEGAVIFAGEFRSYGNVVILDHGGGFFTIYGFLREIKVVVGQQVAAGITLGLCGRDTQGSAMGSGANAVYFEIRNGTSASDPEIWLSKK
ncbi:MAG: peptidoglycan DD-metalloendopeptidase family protein [Elusimicrobiota bacterium]|jgi:septal ring factor EnvC (AmiA/AmiB activator)|nr:peptidoglycan DD-metalloendopeptidase family protein [Elusimicrobiota bacterium]